MKKEEVVKKEVKKGVIAEKKVVRSRLKKRKVVVSFSILEGNRTWMPSKRPPRMMRVTLIVTLRPRLEVMVMRMITTINESIVITTNNSLSPYHPQPVVPASSEMIKVEVKQKEVKEVVDDIVNTNSLTGLKLPPPNLVLNFRPLFYRMNPPRRRVMSRASLTPITIIISNKEDLGPITLLTFTTITYTNHEITSPFQGRCP